MHRTFRITLMAWSCASWLSHAGAARADAIVAPAETASATATPGVVNINTASAEELERLPGIGPTRAQAILALRARRHHFTHIEDLLRVKGIGRTTFRKLKPLLVLQGPTTRVDKGTRRTR